VLELFSNRSATERVGGGRLPVMQTIDTRWNGLSKLPLATLAGLLVHDRDERALAALERNLTRLSRHDPAALAEALGLELACGRRLAAAFELGRRVERARLPRRPRLRSAERVFRLMSPSLRGLERETFHVLLLDSKHRLTERRQISEGTLTASLVHPREVFAVALRHLAAAIVVVHNHPSGDPTPSAEDHAVTQRLVRAGRILGVPVLDHVIVADGGFVSLRERGTGFE